MLLTKQEVRKARARPFKDVHLEELGGELRLATMLAGPALKMEYLQGRIEKDENGLRMVTLHILLNAVIDDKGAPYFDQTSAAQFLDSISSETVGLLLNEFRAINTPPKKTEEEEELGNSKASPADA